jgi:hypothetical protein
MLLRATPFSLVPLCANAQKPYVAPKIWDDATLEDWATPIAAIGVRPTHFTSAEYYAAPVDNLRNWAIS